MPNGEQSCPEHADLRENIAQFEAVTLDYGELMLMDSNVHVDMQNIVSGFTLPPGAAQAFAERGITAPTAVDGVTLNLTYDQFDRHFTLVDGAVGFNNQHIVGFSDLKIIPGEREKHYETDLFLPGQAGKLVMQRIGPSPVSNVEAFFNQCGVHLPLAPAQAEWQTIVPLLASAEHGAVTSQKTTPLSAVHELVVTRQTLESSSVLTDDDFIKDQASWLRRSSRGNRRSSPGSSPAQQHNSPEDIPSAWVEELSVQIVGYGDPASDTIEGVLRTNSPFEPATFKGVYLHEGVRQFASPRTSRSLAGVRPEQQDVPGRLVDSTEHLAQYVTYLAHAVKSAGI